MSIVILVDKGDEQKTIKEERAEWVYQEILAIMVDFKIDEKLAEEMIIELSDGEIADYLTSLKVEIFSHPDGSVDIIKKDKIIAQWKPPKLIMRVEKDMGFIKDREEDKKITKDLRKHSKKRKYKKRPDNFFYEIELNEWRLRKSLSRKKGVENE